MPAEVYLSGTRAEVLAIQVTPDNLEEAAAFVNGEIIDIKASRFLMPHGYQAIRFQGITGVAWAQNWDWLVRYIHAPDMIYAYRNGVFQSMYTKK